MNRLSWRHFGMCFAGFCLVFGGLFGGLVAVEYQYAHETTDESAQEVSDSIERYGVVEYEELSAADQQLVDEAIDGDRHRVPTDDEMVTRWGGGVVVSRGDRYHVFARESVVDWSSPFAIGGLAAGIVGVVLIVESVRRHHFPHYRPFAGVR